MLRGRRGNGGEAAKRYRWCARGGGAAAAAAAAGGLLFDIDASATTTATTNKPTAVSRQLMVEFFLFCFCKASSIIGTGSQRMETEKRMKVKKRRKKDNGM